MSPNRLAQGEGGDPFKEIILQRLADIAKIEAGHIPEEPMLVTTEVGILPLLPSTTEILRLSLKQTYEKTYPELFGGRKSFFPKFRELSHRIL